MNDVDVTLAKIAGLSPRDRAYVLRRLAIAHPMTFERALTDLVIHDQIFKEGAEE